MLQQIVSDTLERDLNKLKEELSLYKNESDLWIVKEGISNSGGNLCVHIVGSFNYLIGTVLGNTGYVRDRAAEFESKNISREKILSDMEATIVMVKKVLQNIPDAELSKDYPLELGGNKFTIAKFLVHLTTHLNYHLGQVNYHRRLLSAP